MKNFPWRGLFALLIIILATSPVMAQTNTRTDSTLVTILKAQTVAASGGTAVSAVIADPAEIKAIDYDSTTASTSNLSIAITYANSSAGPFVTPATVSGLITSITINTTPTSGFNTPLHPYKYAKFTLTNAGTVDLPLLRMTGVRVRSISSTRPAVVRDRVVTVSELAADAITNNANSDTVPADKPYIDPADLLNFWIDGSASGTGTKRVRLRYSNSESGPFVAWEDQESAGYLNEVTYTAVDAAGKMKPFPAKYAKAILRNESGVTYTVNALGFLRRTQP